MSKGCSGDEVRGVSPPERRLRQARQQPSERGVRVTNKGPYVMKKGRSGGEKERLGDEKGAFCGEKGALG